MTTAGFELANELAILKTGRDPDWSEQSAYAGEPTSASDGVYLRDAVSTHILVQMREVPGARTGYAQITAVASGSTYRVVINGNVVSYVAAPGDTAADIIAGLVAALPGVAAADALVTFTGVDTDADGTVDRLRIRGKSTTDYTIGCSATGAGAIACITEYSSGWMRVYFTPGGTLNSSDEPTAWSHPDNATFYVDNRNWVDRFETAGLDRAYVELYSLSGVADGANTTKQAKVFIGPCGLEG